MRKTITILTFVLLAKAILAANYYVAGLPIGSGDGSSAGNAEGYTSWNPSVLSPGDVLHLVGTITNENSSSLIQFYIAKSGTPTSPITIHFEPNAILSVTNGIAFTIAAGNSNIVIDGGQNGVLQQTRTGTGLLYSNESPFVAMSGAGNITIENLFLHDSYIHNNVNDSSPQGGGGVIYANGFSGTNYFLNLTISNSLWCITVLGPTPSMTVSHCTFVNYDHGVVPNSVTNITIINNDFGSTANWDTTGNTYHHDAIHYFGTSYVPQNFVISGNKFHGDWGNNNTAFVYLETTPQNVLMFNNVFIQWPGDYLNDGMVICYGASGQVYNNTFVGSGVYNSGALGVGGTGTRVENNIFNSFTTFINVPNGVVPTFNNNIYANYATGGNNPWSTNGAGYGTFAAWNAAVGDANSFYTNGVVMNSDGTLPIISPAIGNGVNLSSIFTADFLGNSRPSTGAWTIGAYLYSSPTLIYYSIQNK